MSDTIETDSIQLNTGSVVIQWKDRHRSIYSPRFLRLRCPCAGCIDEWSGASLLETSKVPENVEGVDSILVGSYAVQFLWSDAHYTGIYTFKFLRSLCPCEICSLKTGKAEG